MRLAAVALLTLLLVACTQTAPVCSPPYIQNGNSCCLDKDNNTQCDQVAPQQIGGLDCSLCPPQFVTQKEDVIIYRYVCENQSVMDKPEHCGERITSNGHLFRLEEEQDAAFIEEFDIDAACRGKFPAAEVHLVLVQEPQSIMLQILDDPQGVFQNADELEVQRETYYYVGFCVDCQNLIDLQLKDATKAYAVRVVLQYPERKVYSRELLIDPTPQGKIGRKSC